MIIKKVAILLLLAFSLVGCVPAVILAGAAGATLGGAIIYDQRDYKTMGNDHKSRSRAQYALSNDPMLKKGQAHISVSVFNNIALLVGQAKTVDIRNRAYQITQKIPQIRRIYNEITIGPSTSPLQRTNDSWITTKVRTAMLGQPGLRSTNLKVITENNVVYLMGLVSPKQAALATDIARRISGVKKVVKVFEYD